MSYRPSGRFQAPIRHPWWLALVLALLGTLASCSFLRPSVTEISAPPVPVTYPVIRQLATGQFVQCAGCNAPTPKTLGGPVRVASASPTPASKPAAPVEIVEPASAVATVTPDETLLFQFGSAALTETAKARLQELLPTLAKARAISLVGYTDNIGSIVPNDRLAQARALTVMQYLRAELKAPGWPLISSNGKGLCCYLNSNATELGRSANRRVEIQLEGLPTLSPQSSKDAAAAASKAQANGG